ncbi:hypothetical protein OG429_02310 [Streptomyces sp. NBC_00190]|uniref:hypothetical protein n=1 Tax=unclassified Streptomyces TaxID=2593676 RepID=UPI002E2D8222|nr:hypothetical protein [Streptomyces sp. NBC_00190]WSZ38252.1 hypothetical protein OG239_05305 [Streptomyces sp. NBC_00868]
MTPYSLAFYVDVVRTGTVLGLGPGDSPERVAEVFGAEFGENGGRDTLWRDYGLVEFHWQRSRDGDPWSGHHVSLQVHRLAPQDRTRVGGVLRGRYGRFAPRLRFDKLRRLLERRGVPLVEIPEYPSNTPYFRTYWHPASRAAVTVIGAYGEYSTPENLRVGDVYSIQLPMTVEEVAARRTHVA